MRVHQLLSGAGPVDAVTTMARATRERFRAWGWEGGDHAVRIDPRGPDGVVPLSRLRPAPDDVLLFHYSAYAPRLRELLELPNPKLLVSHNITPARFFWDYEPVVAVHCAAGRDQLPVFARAVDLAAGVSEYNAAELRADGAREVTVLPPLFDRAALGRPGPEDRGGPPEVLFVGRVAPHKRPDDVLRVFALYRRVRAPEARLRMVGEPLSPDFGRAVQELADDLAPGAVTFETGLAPEALWDRYRRASAFLCLSEHEGFCLPLLESFHFGVPVVARPAGAIPEVAGDAALLCDDRDPAVAAELLHIAVADTELRAELHDRAQRRLEAYALPDAERRLREAVEGLA